MNRDLCLVILHCVFFSPPHLPPVAQTYSKLTLLTFIFSSPVYLGNVPFSILVGGKYIAILLQGDRAVTLQTADTAGLLLDAEKPPSPGMPCLSN